MVCGAYWGVLGRQDGIRSGSERNSQFDITQDMEVCQDVNERWATWTTASLSASSALVASSLIQDLTVRDLPYPIILMTQHSAKQAAHAPLSMRCWLFSHVMLTVGPHSRRTRGWRRGR